MEMAAPDSKEALEIEVISPVIETLK